MKPQFLHILAWQKYWLMAVSSMVSARLSAVDDLRVALHGMSPMGPASVSAIMIRVLAPRGSLVNLQLNIVGPLEPEAVGLIPRSSADPLDAIRDDRSRQPLVKLCSEGRG